MYIALLVFELMFLFGAGWLIACPLACRRDLAQPLPQSVWPALALTCGLLVNYAVSLLFQPLQTGLLVMGLLAISGWGVFFLQLIRKRLPMHKPNRAVWLPWLVFFAVIALYAGPIIAEPLMEWDARSIWFFHSKMIFHSGTVGPDSGWAQASIIWSHPDYPKLIPALGAQIALLRGVWNEYLPKMALLLLFVSAMLWFFRVYRPSLSFLLLLSALPMILHCWIWCGNMDAYVTLYFMAALLLVGQYAESRKPLDLVAALCCLMVLPHLKNEGKLAMVAFVLAVPFLMVVMRIAPRRLIAVGIRLLKKYWYVAVLLLIFILPLFLWGQIAEQAELRNNLNLFSSSSGQRFMSRLNNGSWMLILCRSFSEFRQELLILIMMMTASLATRKSLPATCWPALFVGCIYLGGLLTVYMVTPCQLEWHLDTSLERVMLAVRGSMIVAAFFILRFLEEQSGLAPASKSDQQSV